MILKNTLYLTVTEFISFLLALLANIFLSRILGPYQRGVYFLILTISTILTLLLDFGVPSACTYFVGKKKHDFKIIHGISIFLSAVLGLFVFLGCLVFLKIGKAYLDFNKNLIVFAVFLFPLMLYNSFWGGLMSGVNKIELKSYLNLFHNATSSLLIMLILFFFPCDKLLAILGMIVAVDTIFLFIKFSFANKISPLDSLVPQFKVLKEVLSFGYKSYLANFAYNIIKKIDVFIVNFFVGSTGVGFYSLSVSLADKVSFLSQQLKGAIVPELSAMEHEKNGCLCAKGTRHTVLISAGLSFLLFAFGPFLVTFLYGFAYKSSILPLLILLPGTIFLLTDGMMSSYFTYQIGRPQIPAFISWTTLVFYVPLSFYFVRSYGVVGAAWSSTICYFLSFVLQLLFFLGYSKEKISDVLFPKTEDFKEYRKIFSLIDSAHITLKDKFKKHKHDK